MTTPQHCIIIIIIIPTFSRLTYVQYWNSGGHIQRVLLENHRQKKTPSVNNQAGIWPGFFLSVITVSLSGGSPPVSHIFHQPRRLQRAFSYSVFRKLVGDENIFGFWVTVASTNSCLSSVVRHEVLFPRQSPRKHNPNSNTIGFCHLLQAKSVFTKICRRKVCSLVAATRDNFFFPFFKEM